MTYGFGLGLTKGGGAGGLPAFVANFIGGSLPTGSTFSRGTIGTLYNQSGLVAYAPSNLLTYSNTFTNANWAATTCTVTPNATTGPSGANDATALVSQLSGSRVVQTLTVGAASAYTYSIYVKAGTQITSPSSVTILLYDFTASATLTSANVNLTNGAIQVGTPTVTAIGNGWYQLSITATTSGTNHSVGVYAYAGLSSSVAGDTVYVYGAQLEQGSNATTYTPTTTAAVYGPRFDFDPGNVLQQNLLLQSGDWSISPWTQDISGTGVQPVVTGNYGVAPDGSNTATRLQLDKGAGAGFSRRQQELAGQGNKVYTGSVWLKTNDGTTKSVAVRNSTDIATVSVTPTWTRFTVSNAAPVTTPSLQVMLWDTAATSQTADLLVWGAQVNVGSTALPYIATTSTAQTVCAPRGLLIEEARTNSLLQSEDFNTTWTTASSTVATNSTTAPDGNTTADKVTSLAATALTGVQGALTGTAVAWTSSVYAKANGAQYLQLLWQTPINATDYANFDLLGGTVTAGTNTASSIQYVGNGWYRCTITSTLIAAAGAVFIDMVGTSAATRGAAFTGDGTKGIYLWGAQAEIGAFATSYIPTTSATVTRNADNLGITAISNWYNTAQGTFLAAFDTNYITNAVRIIGAQSAATGLSIPSIGGSISIFDGNNIFTSNVISTNTAAKAASTYVGSSFTICLNGVTPTSGTGAGTFPLSGVTTIYFGCQAGTSNFLNGHIRSFSYFNYALTNAQLQQITT